MNRKYQALSHATSFAELRVANRQLTGGRFTPSVSAPVQDAEPSAVTRLGEGWWQGGYVRDFATSFAVFFTGAMIFLM
jgi:hypothetical protein